MRTNALFLGSLMLFGSLTASAAATREIHKTVPLDATGRLSIDSHNGSVTVYAWNQPNVSVDAKIEPSEFGDHPEDVQKTEVRFEGQGQELRVRSDYDAVPSHFGWFGESRSLPPIHYTVHIPATARLEVEVHNAKVLVDGIQGGVSVTTHNGDVAATNLAGEAAIETHNGTVRLDYARFTAAGRITTHNASCKVTVPTASRMTLRADTHISNPVSSDLPVRIHASSSNDYSALLNGGGPEFRFTAHNGSLQLTGR